MNRTSTLHPFHSHNLVFQNMLVAYGGSGLVRTGFSQNSGHNFDIFVLCCLLAKDCISTLDFMFKGFFKQIIINIF